MLSNKHTYAYMTVTRIGDKGDHEFEREQSGVCRRVLRIEREGEML